MTGSAKQSIVQLAQAALTQRTEKLADLPRQKLGLLQSAEMAALFHFGPSLDIAIDALGQRSRRMEDLRRKRCIAGRHCDPFPGADEPTGMPPHQARPEQRAPCPCLPINH